ncbi:MULTISPECIES: hypothetical protein [Mycobacteroides]|uniref:Uncharacterized protein n=1 Tax=Mycobacteroides chelonae TaxID=1774 RepID=A0A1S1LEC6_MYCCH|nr:MULTISPECIES: hypothetical protein [Mycobacteroides]KRQ19775.1 hypothetical protein AOT87_19810 [Mycobacteroides sp. H003]KRQ34333.1 hypothetical protein AOT91_06780 [Mycobacteroides sp. H092]KRQ45617.1 hypothetical protein AOT88_19835 [Mycobacteroides sp. H063]KRQ47448.1 hypothetical protein AOT92_00495 [Mycobacteroides sp. H101]KRQ54198.1 hypothetical protein AOT94_25620 [Mycobacteroides sp. HXVII]
MGARSAIREIIEAMPNFFGHRRNVTIGAQDETEAIVDTQAQIADLIAAILPDRLKDKGHLVIQLPAIETDDAGRRYVQVPITARPWADGEVRISPRCDEVAIANTPPILPMHDIPALATALMAAWAARPRR